MVESGNTCCTHTCLSKDSRICYTTARGNHTFFTLDTYFGENEISFVDCTFQKTDLPGITGVTEPTGFGEIGCDCTTKHSFVETFDACEFRSYMQNYKLVSEDSDGNDVVTYNLPMTLISPTTSEATETTSKLIIKNCRFVNENTCTVPYFLVDDNAKFDNIVVYNCFFENYDCSNEIETEKGTEYVYPIFAKLTNNQLSYDISDHNIFAKCNMRSSKPDEDRTNGTTINEMVEYE